MNESIPDPEVAAAMSIIDRGLPCAIEVDEGHGWEPRLLAFPSAPVSAVAAAVADERFRNPRVRAVPVARGTGRRSARSRRAGVPA